MAVNTLELQMSRSMNKIEEKDQISTHMYASSLKYISAAYTKMEVEGSTHSFKNIAKISSEWYSFMDVLMFWIPDIRIRALSCLQLWSDRKREKEEKIEIFVAAKIKNVNISLESTYRKNLEKCKAQRTAIKQKKKQETTKKLLQKYSSTTTR